MATGILVCLSEAYVRLSEAYVRQSEAYVSISISIFDFELFIGVLFILEL